MSAYGPIKRSTTDSSPLPASTWPIESASDHRSLSIHHLTLSTAQRLEGLLDHLTAVFAQEVQDGLTYPQEGEMDRSTFDGYFFSADVFVGIIGDTAPINRREGEVADPDIEVARGGRPWDQCVAGFYYIKPNYPGRSSHICNAGFVVSPTHRGKGYGSVLAKSYVHYAPKLGFQASVFNLVYVNNFASIKLWERLDFIKAGLIPRAGRLKRKDGQGEEYVDAFVFYKSFVEDK
ncbi:hypothetical protein FPV67DRAFT_1488598 [Lyophyllum atratum]|nr:hypothetical protein FPV67DRAFT_1488598 [Lyophyllum atratum]